jgi:hypothetical protein
MAAGRRPWEAAMTAEAVRLAESPIPAGARLVQVALDGAVFGLAVADGRVVAAAPIANKRALGREWATVVAYYQSRGARFREVRDMISDPYARRAVGLATALGHDIDSRPGRMDCRRCCQVALRRGLVFGTATEEPCPEPFEWHLPPEDTRGGCKR